MSIYISLLISLLGLVIFMIAKDGKVEKLGEICFSCGLLAFLLTSVPKIFGVVIK